MNLCLMMQVSVLKMEAIIGDESDVYCCSFGFLKK